MPRIAVLDLLEPHAKEVLVYLQNLWNHERYGEVLLHKRVVQVKLLLGVLAVVVPIVPDVELPIERETPLSAVFLFHSKENVALFVSNGLKFGDKVLDELQNRKLSVRKGG